MNEILLDFLATEQHTFLEMLGNSYTGACLKREAIARLWNG